MTKRLPPVEFERFPENIGWQADVRALAGALHHPEGFYYEARLPDIIGYVPDSERRNFSSVLPRAVGDPCNFVCLGMKREEVARLYSYLPETLRILEDDTRALTGGRAALSEFELRRQFVKAGSDPNFYGLHLDIGVSADKPEVAELPIYVVSDTEPTWLYAGPAMLHMPDLRSVRLHPGSIDTSIQLVQLPPFAIARLSYATIHTSPIFAADATRTFMRVFASMRPDV